MANNSYGTLQIGNTSMIVGSDGMIYDQNFNKLGAWRINSVPHFPGHENIILTDTNGNLWATVNYDADTGKFSATGKDPNTGQDITMPVNWTANPNAPQDPLQPPPADNTQPPPTGDTTPPPSGGTTPPPTGGGTTPTDPSQLYLVGTIEYNNATYQIVSDGTDQYKLWYNGAQIGYIQTNADGSMWNLYNNDNAHLYTLNPANGTMFDASTGEPLADNAIMRDAFNNEWTYTTPDATADYRGQITITTPDGSTIGGYMTIDGRIVDSNGETLLTYAQTSDNEYQLRNLDGTDFGSYDTSTGIVNYAGGGTGYAHWNPYETQTPTDPITTTSDSSTTTSNVSGIDWSSPVAAALLPSVTESALAMPGLAEQAGTQAQEKYSNLMTQALGPQAFQGYLNALGKRGVLDSSITEGALGSAATQIAQGVGNKAFDASLAGTQAQMQVPGYLSNIVSGLGGQTGTTTGTTSDTTTVDNPYAAWNAWLNLINV